ncbi:DUF5110 domain-containing protein, partial [Streptomyces sp. SAS_269]|uniref:DUF5110 domain-containing protein n=1 Tax=Streptomyces sp. SAS_269 TaxID=3412749 RepID=UPI00403C8EF4
PVTTPGDSATTSVWFPPGQWTDYFTGKTYTGGTTHDITTALNSMPVFVKAGGILPTRTHNVAHNDRNALTGVTLTISTGASGSYSLYEDNGATAAKSATTRIRYRQTGSRHTVSISPVKGAYPGQVDKRRWTLTFLGSEAPAKVSADGAKLSPDAYHWDGDTGMLTITLPRHSVHTPITVAYQ